jgi:hypothetical protein
MGFGKLIFSLTKMEDEFRFWWKRRGFDDNVEPFLLDSVNYLLHNVANFYP